MAVYAETTVNLECNIRFSATGSFVSAHRKPTIRMTKDGVPYIQQEQPPVDLSLAEVKAFVAAL